jgi:hypothetical protein
MIGAESGRARKGRQAPDDSQAGCREQELVADRFFGFVLFSDVIVVGAFDADPAGAGVGHTTPPALR